jgi:hypothetical protein
LTIQKSTFYGFLSENGDTGYDGIAQAVWMVVHELLHETIIVLINVGLFVISVMSHPNDPKCG